MITSWMASPSVNTFPYQHDDCDDECLFHWSSLLISRLTLNRLTNHTTQEGPYLSSNKTPDLRVFTSQWYTFAWRTPFQYCDVYLSSQLARRNCTYCDLLPWPNKLARKICVYKEREREIGVYTNPSDGTTKSQWLSSSFSPSWCFVLPDSSGVSKQFFLCSACFPLSKVSS